MSKTKLTKTAAVPLSRDIFQMTAKDQVIHIFPPRDAEEAKTRSVFVKDGLTYAHFNSSLAAGLEGVPGNNGLVHCYGELADKLGELLMAAARAGTTPRSKQLTVVADINVEVKPVFAANGEVSGNETRFKIYGFQYEDMYFTTQDKMLRVTRRVVPQVQGRASKVAAEDWF